MMNRESELKYINARQLYLFLANLQEPTKCYKWSHSISREMCDQKIACISITALHAVVQHAVPHTNCSYIDALIVTLHVELFRVLYF